MASVKYQCVYCRTTRAQSESQAPPSPYQSKCSGNKSGDSQKPHDWRIISK